MAERSEEVKEITEEVLAGKTDVAEVVTRLAEGARRERQVAAAALYQVAKEKPEMLVDHIDEIVDALNRPEAQTRWECLETLTILVDYDARTCGKAVPEAEAALFDEESGPVRLAAMRFLCKFGATTANRSEKVWPLIDEGIQCYHGDLEFNDMMTAVIDFSKGKLAATTPIGKALMGHKVGDVVDAKTPSGIIQFKVLKISL